MPQLFVLASLFLLAATQLNADAEPRLHDSSSPQPEIDHNHLESHGGRHSRQTSRRECRSDNSSISLPSTIEEVMKNCRTVNQHRYPFIVNKVNLAIWNDFIANLEEIAFVEMAIIGSRITQMNLPKMKYWWPHYAFIVYNPNLTSISFPNGVHFRIIFGFTISKNERLEQIDFGQPNYGVEHNMSYSFPQLTIRENKKLKTIDGDLNAVKNANIAITGNPKLDETVLDKFRQLPNPDGKRRYFQKRREDPKCGFNYEISNVAELTRCKFVNGDLKLAKVVKGLDVNTTLPPIQQNLHIWNLKEEELGFINRSTIGGNVVCKYDREIDNLGDLKLCDTVWGDLRLAKDVKETARSRPSLQYIENFYWKDPQEELPAFLNETQVGSIYCIFDEAITNLVILKLCEKVEGDLKLAGGFGGSVGSTSLTKIDGNVDIKDLKEEQLGFLKNTNVTGKIESWCLSTLHGKEIIKTPNPAASCPPDEEGGLATWLFVLICCLAGLLLISGVLLVYFFVFKKKGLKRNVTQRGTKTEDQKAAEGVRKTPVDLPDVNKNSSSSAVKISSGQSPGSTS